MAGRNLGLDFARRAWFARSAGLGLSVLAFGSVLYQRDAAPWLWLLLLAWGFAWPTLAYVISSRHDKPYAAEHRNLIIDAFFGGAWVALTAFNAVPALVFNILNLLGIFGAGGPSRLARATAVMALGCAVAMPLTGFDFAPHSSLTTVVCTIPVMVLYGMIIGKLTHDLTRRLTAQTRRLEAEVKKRSDAEVVARRAQRDAEEANRAKSDFLSHMSHELRTPLNAVIGFSEAMLAGVGGTLNDRHARYAQDIASSGRYLLSLISDILDLSKLEARMMELDEDDVDVRETVDRSLLLVRDRGRAAGLSFATDVADDTPRLFADKRKVNQMLVNLLTNAVKFTPAGGTVTVSARRVDGGCLALVVSDTGPGISPEDIPRALSPYQQLGDRHRSEGTGLGLPLVKSMAELHGGSFILESEVGVGTTATIVFPAKRVRAGATSA